MLPTASPTFRRTSNFKAARSDMAARTLTDRALYGGAVLVEALGNLDWGLHRFFLIRRSAANGGPTVSSMTLEVVTQGRVVDYVMACRINSARLRSSQMFQPLGEVGMFFLGHAGFDHMAAVGCVVFTTTVKKGGVLANAAEIFRFPCLLPTTIRRCGLPDFWKWAQKSSKPFQSLRSICCDGRRY